MRYSDTIDFFDFRNANGTFAGRCTIAGSGTHRVFLSKVQKGTELFMEASENGDPLLGILSARGGNAEWDIKTISLADINRISEGRRAPKSDGLLNQWVRDFGEGTKSSQIGENPSFLCLRATTNDAKITVGSHGPGEIFRFNAASKIAVVCRPGAFLLGQKGIKMDQYPLNSKIAKLLGYPFWQKITGSGFFCLEINSNTPQLSRMLPGEELIVEPQHLVAMTTYDGDKSISIVDAWNLPGSSGTTAQKAANVRGFLKLKAGSIGGTVIISDLAQKPPKKPDDKK